MDHDGESELWVYLCFTDKMSRSHRFPHGDSLHDTLKNFDDDPNGNAHFC
jgi:hypothetical protein